MHSQAPLFCDLARAPNFGSAFWTHADDGVRIRLGVWRLQDGARGTVLILPGRTECIEKYGYTIQAFAEAGFNCIVIDWRGHGLSGATTENAIVSHVQDFSEYQCDMNALLTFATSVSLPKPWFTFSHSMGGCIALRTLSGDVPIAASVFTAPMWGIHLSPLEKPFALPVTWAATVSGFGHCFAPGNVPQQTTSYVLSVPFEGNRLTRNEKMFDHMVKLAEALPALRKGAPSFGWVYSALRECRSLEKSTSPKTPALAFQGLADKVVDPVSTTKRIAAWPGGEVHKFNGARHDLLYENDEVRDKIHKDSIRFFALCS